MGGSGVPEGTPEWLDDPSGALPHPPLLTADTSVLLFRMPNPPLVGVKLVAPPSAVSVHSPPRSPAGLRAPPSRS